MTKNKMAVQTYIEGFRRSHHNQVLLCPADVEWIMPGFFHLVGKEAFDKEIENENFIGRPTITITSIIYF
jgi:hypothetical protein